MKHVRKSLIFSVISCVFGFLVSEQVYAQPLLSFSIQEIRTDENSDGLPDHLGERITLTGLVTIGTGILRPDSLDIFVQDLTSGIRLTGLIAAPFLSEGDSIIARGLVKFESGNLSLNVEEIESFGKTKSIIQPQILSTSTRPIQSYEGLLLRTAGYVTARGSDHLGSYLILSTSHGVFVVRKTVLQESVETNPAAYKVGENITVTGVLVFSGMTGTHIISHQIFTRSSTDIQSVFIPAHLIPWIGLVLMCFLIVTMFIVGGTRRKKARLKWRKYFTIYKEIGGAIVVSDLDLRIIESNAAASHLFHAPRNNFRFRNLLNIIQTEEQKDTILSDLERNGQKKFNATFVHKNELVLDLEITSRPVEIEGLARIISIIHDVSKEKEKFRRYESFLEKLIDDMPIQIVILSNEGKYFYVNPEAVPDKNIREWLIGKSDFEFCEEYGIHVEIALRRRGFRRQAVEHKEVVSFEECIKTTSGEERHFLRIYSPHIDQQGK